MGKSVVITQSNYLPWKGFFDNIALVDEFIIYDCVQYTRRDWRNRNRIKTANGLHWLTVPVRVRGQFHQSIQEVQIDGQKWAKKHWKTLEHVYGKQPGFEILTDLISDILNDMPFRFLSELNQCLIEKITDFLDISTNITPSSEFNLRGGKTERLVNICNDIGATRYYSGPSAKAYLEEDLFRDCGIEVLYFDYTYTKEYDQPHPPFTHQVSIVDLIACCGENSRNYLKVANQ